MAMPLTSSFEVGVAVGLEGDKDVEDVDPPLFTENPVDDVGVGSKVIVVAFDEGVISD